MMMIFLSQHATLELTHTSSKIQEPRNMSNDMLLLEPNAVAVDANASVCGLDGTYLSITTQAHTSQLYTHIEIDIFSPFVWMAGIKTNITDNVCVCVWMSVVGSFSLLNQDKYVRKTHTPRYADMLHTHIRASTEINMLFSDTLSQTTKHSTL